MHLIYVMIAAGTALTASSTETVLASTTLPANSFSPGKVYRVRGSVIATATNSTDTLTINVRVGPTTLTGTIVAASGAVDAANSDVVTFDVELVVRNVGAASIVIASGTCTAVGAEAVATARASYESLSLASTSAQKIEVTGTWSTTSGSNSCRADTLTVTEIVQ